MHYRVTNVTRQTVLAERAQRADTFGARFRGLMGVRHLPDGEGLHIEPCSSIHTFFMRIPIDAIFLDARLTVVDVVHALPAWTTSKVYFTARSVLELPAGAARARGCEAGDVLVFTAVEPAPAP